MRLPIALCLFLILIASCQAAFAATCAPRDVVVANLAKRHGETRRSVVLTDRGALVEIFANPEAGSWTIIATRPDGIACLVGSGSAYHETRAPTPQEDPDA